jgi:hypothetical protein
MYLGCANTCEDIALLYNQYKIEKTERITNWTGRKWVPAVFLGFSVVLQILYIRVLLMGFTEKEGLKL